MKILFLHAEVMGYTMATINALINSGNDVHVIHWDHKKLTPYQPPSISNLHMYPRSQMNKSAITKIVNEISPTITVVSGWMDKDYLSVVKGLRAKKSKVVVGFDDQWHGTIRQRWAALLGAFGFFNKYFSHAWVSGSYQFEYARRLGFNKKNIIFDLYSADIELFQKAYEKNVNNKHANYPRRFLFVGRFESIKGLDILLEAWEIISRTNHNWELHLVGNGSMKERLMKISGIIVKDFMQPDELMSEVADAGCFVLPSQGEPWGVVIHEFAAAGLPIIASNVVGAASSFIIPGMNGVLFSVDDAKSLASKMLYIMELDNSDLARMGDISNALAKRITPESSAANLISIEK